MKPCFELPGVTQAAGCTDRSFLSMALENLKRENNYSEQEIKRLKASSFQLYAGEVRNPLSSGSLTHTYTVTGGAETVCTIPNTVF